VTSIPLLACVSLIIVVEMVYAILLLYNATVSAPIPDLSFVTMDPLVTKSFPRLLQCVSTISSELLTKTAVSVLDLPLFKDSIVSGALTVYRTIPDSLPTVDVWTQEPVKLFLLPFAHLLQYIPSPLVLMIV